MKKVYEKIKNFLTSILWQNIFLVFGGLLGFVAYPIMIIMNDPYLTMYIWSSGFIIITLSYFMEEIRKRNLKKYFNKKK